MNTTQLDNETLQMLSSGALRVWLPVVYSMVVLISLPCNGVSFWLLCFHTRPKTPLTIFLINLTLADLLLAFFLPFQIAYHVNHNHWVFGKGLCTFVTTVFYANMYCSILTMTCISVERYVGVLYPIRYAAWRDNRYAVAICVVMWAITLIILLPLEYSDLTFRVEELGITTCFDVLKRSVFSDKGSWGIFIFSIITFLFFIPFTITVLCYTRLIVRLCRREPKARGSGQKGRAVCLATLVVLVFVVCFTPSNITLLFHIILRLLYGRGCYEAYKVTLSLSCLNSCLDPFIFCFASKQFSSHLRQLLGGWRSRGPRDSIELQGLGNFAAGKIR
ncbi:P2Y purinoceptor 8-like [Callorhinchus milii]|uniref:P2Y purinoceptor 8-like n=1 Tax=Callorhinchus milii TaxID=7868 RepID=UPI0004574035|nr:P2Y purinoceptor 8-like [Callorhinchus milii]|eukprot:gi/632948245/ref/XP_007889484.1/ PREDICTED: P2Y purinoceptor 8-like [Callorhinchus milii]